MRSEEDFLNCSKMLIDNCGFQTVCSINFHSARSRLAPDEVAEVMPPFPGSSEAAGRNPAAPQSTVGKSLILPIQPIHFLGAEMRGDLSRRPLAWLFHAPTLDLALTDGWCLSFSYKRLTSFPLKAKHQKSWVFWKEKKRKS